jgi:LysR family glycine cleavage system transcriptional activator
MSVKDAAEELFVTQAAVSQQIRQLEEGLGVTLFVRKHRAIELTKEGHDLLPHLQAAFDAMKQGLDSVLMDANPDTITLSVLPSFASRWLIPRLGRLYDACPGLTVNLAMSDHLETFVSGNVDLGIRFGRGDYDGLQSDELMRDFIYPVCHPSYFESHPVNTVEDLLSVRLLDDVADNIAWEYWLQKKGVAENLSERVRFNGSHYVIDSALSGQGIAMVRHSLVAEAVRQGNLITLLGDPVALDYRYYLCGLPHSFQKQRVKRFIDWIREEVKEFVRMDAGNGFAAR